MGQIMQRHVRALLQCLETIYAHASLETFPARILSALPQVVPTELTAYNEVDPVRRRALAIVEHPELLPPEAERILAEHAHEHPLIASHQRTGDGHAHTISDFLTQGQFHRLGLYNELYRPMDAEDQMAITLPSAPPLLIAITINRSRRTFSAQDRLLLNLLHPHLIQAYRNAEAVSRVQQELALLRQAVEESPCGIIMLAGDGGVRWMTERARQWVEVYFGRSPYHADSLPDTLQRWVAAQQTLLAHATDVPSPREPLVVEQAGKRLVIRFIAERAGEQHLMLEEERLTPSPRALEALGLTRREADVLGWVAQGKTNPEIATILGLSPLTVRTHLEHILPEARGRDPHCSDREGAGNHETAQRVKPGAPRPLPISRHVGSGLIVRSIYRKPALSLRGAGEPKPRAQRRGRRNLVRDPGGDCFASLAMTTAGCPK